MGSDVAAIHTEWQSTFAPSVPQYMYHGHAYIGLPEKADHLKPLVLSYMHFCI